MTVGNEENLKKIQEARAQAEILRAQETVDLINEGGDGVTRIPIDFTTERDKNFKGVIGFKHMTMFDFARAGAEKSRMFIEAGITTPEQRLLVDATVQFLIHVVSNLTVAIVDAPAWLKDKQGNLAIEGNDHMDLIFHIYDKYEEWQNSFRKPSEADGTEDNQASEAEEALDA